MTRVDERLDAAAFEALYVRLEKRVFNTVYRWVWNRAEAMDVTQDAFMNVWKARARVPLAQAEPLVFRAAVNLASNRLRARRLRQLFSLERAAEMEDPADAAPTSMEAQQRARAVRHAVEALPEKLRRVVMLAEFSGLSTAQIAEVLEIPQGTVGSRRSLAMAALEKTLGEIDS